MYLNDGNGNLVNAECSFDIHSGKQSIVIESCGGSPRRNPDYNQLVEIVLSRIQSSGAVILDILLESSKTQGMTDNQKQVQLSTMFPINLVGLKSADLNRLRKEIGSSIAKMYRNPSASSTGGNPQKRFRIVYDQYIPYDKMVNSNGSDQEDKAINANHTLSATEKEYIRKSRIGQGLFRKNVVSLYKKCAVLSIVEEDLLIASHIKPWSASTNAERLDHYNGILLSALFDRLFDKGFITIDSHGVIIVSSRLNSHDKKACGLTSSIQVKLDPKSKPYLVYHRVNVFK